MGGIDVEISAAFAPVGAGGEMDADGKNFRARTVTRSRVVLCLPWCMRAIRNAGYRMRDDLPSAYSEAFEIRSVS